MKKKPIIGIVDTKTSNIKSVFYALSLQNVEINYILNGESSVSVDAMVVPGIGNFGYVMDKLRENNLDKYIIKTISKKIPCLFICVGMQILFTKSYELGEHNGLNIFEGEVNKIEETDSSGRKVRNVPAIGWNKIEYKNKCKSFKDVADNSFFYFTHSYFVKPKDKKIVSSTSNYCDFNYCSSISKDKIVATQFHPEKSGESGLKIYKNFIKNI